ncbi:hypothetical protein, partial [Chitinophaga sp. sic0106]|uniref:Ig-like domain-containing protein n=1 Tax=Chitinophaga sp. sic0106 TaxID=2854785 RepID=UPI001C4552C0
MKRFLTLILLLLSFLLARQGVMAQSNATPPTGQPTKPFMNIPINVCAGNFASINAFIWDSTYRSGGQDRQFNYPNVKVDWSITGGAFAVLYNNKPDSANGKRDTTITNQTSDSYKVNALTIRFNTPGVVYTVTANITYTDARGATRTATISRTITSVDCSITECKGSTTMSSDFLEDFGRFRKYTDNSLSNKPRAYWVAGAVGYNYNDNIFYSYPNPDIGGDFSDNSYAIYWNTKLRSEWDSVGDHTGQIRYISPTSDSVGGMLIANSANDKRIFYTRDVTVCPGSQYNFSAWFLNTNTREVFNSTCIQGNSTGYRYAGVTFKILDSLGNVLKQFKTFDVSMNLNTTGERWLPYGGTFKVPGGIKKLKLQIVNDNEGGCGNDIAIDDIKFNYCSPNIYGFVDGLKDDGVTESVQCAGSAINLTAWYTPNGFDPNDPSKPYDKNLDYFTQKVFRWEYSYNDTTYYTLTDSIGVNTETGVTETIRYGSQDSVLHFLPGALQGNPTQPVIRYYRLNIFEKGNENIKDCGSPSTPIAITILPKPVVKLSSSAICLGDNVNLTVEGQYTRYEWRAPAEIAGIKDEAVVVSPTHNTTYTAYGYANYGAGRVCVDSGSATIRVDTPAIVHVTGGPIELCAGQTSTSFQIEPENNKYTIRWSSTWPVAQDTVYGSTTNVLNNIYPWHVGDNYFKATVTKGVCVTRDSLLVQVRSMPIAKTNLDELVGQCNKTQFTMKANQPLSDQKGTWTFIRGVSNGSSTITNPNLYNTTVNITPAGTKDTLIWTVVNNNKSDCISRDTVILYNTKPLTVPKSMGSTQVCVVAGESVVLNLNGTRPENEGEFGKWTSNPVTNVTFANDALYNTTATIVGTASPTNYTLYWTINNGICPAGPSASMAVRTKTPPTIAITNSPVLACNTTPTVRLNITSGSSTITDYSITTTSGNPMPGFVPVTAAWTGASYIDMTIPANTPAGIYTFVMNVWERNTTTNEQLAGCSKTVTFTVNLSEPTTPPTDITVNNPAICGRGNVLLTLNGAELGTNPDGTVASVWKWYKGSCGGTPVTPDSANADNSIVLFRNVTATTTYYVRGESAGTCGNSICIPVTVTVYQQPAVPTATPEQSHCNMPTFTMDASNPSPAGAAGKWSIIGGSATGVVITDPGNPKTTVTVPAGTFVELKWAVSNGVCDSVSTTVKLYNYATNPAAEAGPDQEDCGRTTAFQLGATPVVSTGNIAQIGTWTVQYTGTNTAPTVSDIHNPAATITVPVGDQVQLTWTVTSVLNGTIINQCPATTDQITLYNFANNPAANAGADQEDCGRTTAFTLNATPVVSAGNIQQVGTWTVQYTGANAAPTVSNVHDPRATITVAPGDQVQLTWTVTSIVNGVVNTNCPATTDVVTIYNYAANPAANAGADQEDCGRTTAFTLDATPVVSTGNIQQIGTWTVQYTGANPAPVVSDIHDPKATIVVPVGDQVQLTWTVTSIVNGVVNTNCPATTDVVTIYNYAANPAANAGADQEDCGRTTAFTLDATPVVSTGNIQQIGTWTVQYTGANAAPVVSDIHNPKATIVVPVGDQVQLTWTVTSIVNGVIVTTCPATTDAVIIRNFDTDPLAEAGANQEDCGRTTAFTLDATPVVSTGNIQQIGTWTVQYTGANTAPVVSDIHDPKATITVTPGDQVQLTWTVTSIVNGVVNTNCPATTDVVTIYNYAANPAANAGADQEDCSRTTAFTLDATPVVSTGNIQQIGTWTVQYTGANAAPVVSDIHDPKATITVTPGDQVQLTWTITSIANGVVNTNCPATTDVVTIYNYAANPAANAGVDQEDCGR